MRTKEGSQVRAGRVPGKAGCPYGQEHKLADAVLCFWVVRRWTEQSFLEQLGSCQDHAVVCSKLPHTFQNIGRSARQG